MRVGEILIIGPKSVQKESLLKKLCDRVELPEKGIQVGWLSLDDEMLLQFYGIHWNRFAKSYAWDLLVTKALGVIVLFDWDRYETVQTAEEIVAYFQENFDIPLVVASEIGENSSSLIVRRAYQGGLVLNKNSKFTLYQFDQSDSIRQLVVDLVNINLEHVSA
ncbi:MAG: hypothetical protein GXO76_10440 [Calditrichaeota bacterium]|nr:hypothetical protein [Calditrichota bacterium]